MLLGKQSSTPTRYQCNDFKISLLTLQKKTGLRAFFLAGVTQTNDAHLQFCLPGLSTRFATQERKKSSHQSQN